MAQFLRPDSDISQGNWIPAGILNFPYNLWPEIDEDSQDGNTTHIIAEVDREGTAFEVGFSVASNPDTGTRTLRIVARKDVTSGDVFYEWELRQGATLVQGGTDYVTDSWTTYSHVITGSISDYSDLSLYVRGRAGSTSYLRITQVEFEIPDAAGGGGKPSHKINSKEFTDLTKVLPSSVANISKVNGVTI